MYGDGESLRPADFQRADPLGCKIRIQLRIGSGLLSTRENAHFCG